MSDIQILGLFVVKGGICELALSIRDFKSQ